jgi:hypothetical protein
MLKKKTGIITSTNQTKAKEIYPVASTSRMHLEQVLPRVPSPSPESYLR